MTIHSAKDLGFDPFVVHDISWSTGETWLGSEDQMDIVYH